MKRVNQKGVEDEDENEDEDEDTKEPPTGAEAQAWCISCAHLCSNIFKLSLMSYYFWTSLLFFVGATVALAGFQVHSPKITSKVACPIQPQWIFFGVIWLIQGILAAFVAFSCSTVDGPEDAVNEMSRFSQLTGFAVKVLPTWLRLIHVYNLFQLLVMTLQLLLLPECNSNGLVYIFGAAYLFWWAIVIAGIIIKTKIFLPPLIYEPVRPGGGFVRDLHKTLRGMGP
eukprot:GHVU01031079.1.p1 GENE.GHVU01031079.1~~GHVU01031079.1.p1  ORF type:complete len:227 (+),score=17.50 GHVU01031079.1:193-873(+)